MISVLPMLSLFIFEAGKVQVRFGRWQACGMIMTPELIRPIAPQPVILPVDYWGQRQM